MGLRGAWGEERWRLHRLLRANGFDSVNRLLGGRYPHPQLEASFDGKGDFRRYPSLIYIGLGLGRDFKDTPHMQSFTLDEPLALEGGVLKIKRLNLRLFTFDPTMAPEGKTSATAMIETSNDAYWTELRGRDRAACEAEKAQTARKVIAALDGFVPGLGNFYMIGQWTSPGDGLPPCGIGGRGLAKKLCRLEGRRFKAD